VDLKSFDDAFYRKELGGGLEDVKRFIAAAAGRIALEVTTLVIPGRTTPRPRSRPRRASWPR